jgi:hypothetical protein
MFCFFQAAILGYTQPKTENHTNYDFIVKNQKEILDSIRMIKEKLGIEDPIKDPENPVDHSTDQSGQEDEENRKKKARSALASLKWKAAIQALNSQKSDE